MRFKLASSLRPLIHQAMCQIDEALLNHQARREASRQAVELDCATPSWLQPHPQRDLAARLAGALALRNSLRVGYPAVGECAFHALVRICLQTGGISRSALEDRVLPANEGGEMEWWTFAGQQVNETLADLLRHRYACEAEVDSLSLRLRLGVDRAREVIQSLRALSESEIIIQIDPDADLAFKFSEILPAKLKEILANSRGVNIGQTRLILYKCERVVHVQRYPTY